MKKGDLRIFPVVLSVVTLVLSAPSSAADDCGQAKGIYQRGAPSSDYLQKVKFYQRAIELCPDYAEAYNNLADSFEHLGKYDEVIAAYGRAIKLKPELACAYFGMGDTYLRIGLFEKAAQFYEAGLKLKPTDQLALTGLEIAKRGVPAAQGTQLLDYLTIIDNLKDNTITAMGRGGVRQKVSRIRFHNILFDFDSAEIKPAAIPQLDEIGKALSSPALRGREFVIEGHTDNIGTERYNINLSRKRAESVRRYLIKNFHAPAASLRCEGYGGQGPSRKTPLPKGGAKTGGSRSWRSTNNGA